MLTAEQVLDAVKAGRKSQCFDGRDYSRLSDFFPVAAWGAFGFSLNEGAEEPAVRPWTREEVLSQLAKDLDFAFEKALDKRGLSAGFMHAVVKMWMWVLEDDLQHADDNKMYPQYGLPFLKAVALKYGLPNQIGDDAGNEPKYSTYG